MNSYRKLLDKLAGKIAKLQLFANDLDIELAKFKALNSLPLENLAALRSIFGKQHQNFSTYVGNIYEDFNILTGLSNLDLQKFYILQIEKKITALLQIMRTYKILHHRKVLGSWQYLDHRRELSTEASMLSKIQKSLQAEVDLLQKELHKLSNSAENLTQRKNLQDKILNLLVKLGNCEKRLFSIRERLDVRSSTSIRF